MTRDLGCSLGHLDFSGQETVLLEIVRAEFSSGVSIQLESTDKYSGLYDPKTDKTNISINFMENSFQTNNVANILSTVYHEKNHSLIMNNPASNEELNNLQLTWEEKNSILDYIAYRREQQSKYYSTSSIENKEAIKQEITNTQNQVNSLIQKHGSGVQDFINKWINMY